MKATSKRQNHESALADATYTDQARQPADSAKRIDTNDPHWRMSEQGTKEQTTSPLAFALLAFGLPLVLLVAMAMLMR